MPQQQALSPVALAQRYAYLQTRYRWIKWPKVVWAVLLCVSGLPLALMQLGIMPLWWLVHGPLTFLFFFCIPAILNHGMHQEALSKLYAELLTVFKDDTLPLSLAERIAILAVLPRSSQPPLRELAQARLAQKLAYASPAELAVLPRTPLHAWLRDRETPDDLRISLLLALGTLHDHAIRPLAQEIVHLSPTERLREAALECLKSLESAP